MSSSRCNPFWVESPSILWEEWADFFPFTEKARKCTANALNSLTRFGLYLGVILAILHKHGAYFGITLGIAVLSVAAYYGMKQRNILREGFENGIVGPTLFTTPGSTPPNFVGGFDVANKNISDVIIKGTLVPETRANAIGQMLRAGKPDEVARVTKSLRAFSDEQQKKEIARRLSESKRSAVTGRLVGGQTPDTSETLPPLTIRRGP